jgi:hypothetical protein
MESVNEAENKTKEVGAMKTLKNTHCRERIHAFLYFFAISFFLFTLGALDGRLTKASHAATFNVTTEAELQAALTAAQSNGEDDTINIAAGTYNTGDNGGNPFTYNADSDEDFSLTVNGAGAATTILDGGNSTPVLIIDAGLFSDLTDADITIKNLTIQNARSNGTFGFSGGIGGGLTVSNAADITVDNCIFSNNTLVDTQDNFADILVGGGANLVCIGDCDITLTNNMFKNNSVISTLDASTGAGGVFANAGLKADSEANLTATNNTFESNTASAASESAGPGGAGLAVGGDRGDLTLTNNIFKNNSVSSSSSSFPHSAGAGALAATIFTPDNNMTLLDNHFDNNSATSSSVPAFGGGALIDANLGNLILTNNRFTNNSVNSSSGDVQGGGLDIFDAGNFIFTNNVFVNNTSNSTSGDAFGGGAFLGAGLANTLTNNTFTLNTTSGDGGGFFTFTVGDSETPDIYNNIIWNNTAWGNGDDIFVADDTDSNNTGSSVNLFNNDFKEFFSQCANTAGCTPNISQGNNINKDPLFVDAVNWDVHLLPTSPAINVGDPNAPSIPDEDFEGDPRDFGGAPDMGADETFVQIVNNLVKFVPIQSTFKTVTNTSGCPAGFTRKFSFQSRLTNISQDSDLYDLFSRVKTLTNNNLLQNADGGPGGVGSTLTVPEAGSFSDGELSPGEFVDVPFVICLKNRNKFSFFVDVLGVVGEID